MLLKDNLYTIKCGYLKSTVLLVWQTYTPAYPSHQSRYRIFIIPKSSLISLHSKPTHNQLNAKVSTLCDYTLLLPVFFLFHTYKIIQYIIFCVCLLLHSKLFLRFIYDVALFFILE